MDHYRKISSRLIENAILPNEIRISSATGKPAGVIQKIQSLIHEHKEGVVISASGSHMTKAIEIIEHIKRKKSVNYILAHHHTTTQPSYDVVCVQTTYNYKEYSQLLALSFITCKITTV
jgi:DNA-binding protein